MVGVVMMVGMMVVGMVDASSDTTETGGNNCVGTAAVAAVITAVLILAGVGGVLCIRKRRAAPRTKVDLEAAERAAYVNPNFCGDTAGAVSLSPSDLSPNTTLPYTLDQVNGVLKASKENNIVQLRATDFAGLGFTVSGSLKDGIHVKELLNKGPAALSGKVKVGDRLLALTVVMENCTKEDAVSLLSSASPYPVLLHLQQSPEVRPDAQSPKRKPHSARAVDLKTNESCFKSQSSGDLSKISSVKSNLSEEEALVCHSDASCTRKSDTAIDQLADARMLRDTKQGRHSERAIDVPDAILKLPLQVSQSERAIDSPDSALKSSSAYGELQTSTSERTIDVPTIEVSKLTLQESKSERAIDKSGPASKSSSPYGKLQASLSERTIDVPEAVMKLPLQASQSERIIGVPNSLVNSAPDYSVLPSSLSDRALDIQTSSLKRSSIFGELHPMPHSRENSPSLEEEITDATDEGLGTESPKSPDKSFDSFVISSVSPSSISPVAKVHEQELNEAEHLSTAHGSCSSLENDDDEENTSIPPSGILWGDNALSCKENLESPEACVEVTIAKTSIEIIPNEGENPASIKKDIAKERNNDEDDEETVSSNIEIKHYSRDITLSQSQDKDEKEDMKGDLSSETQVFNSAPYQESDTGGEPTTYIPLQKQEVNTHNEENAYIYPNEDLDLAEKLENSDDSDDERTAEAIRLINTLSNATKMTKTHDSNSALIDEAFSLYNSGESRAITSRTKQLFGSPQLATTSGNESPEEVELDSTREHQDHLQSSKSTATVNKKVIAQKVSSPNDRSNIFGMYVNHEFCEPPSSSNIQSMPRFEQEIDNDSSGERDACGIGVKLDSDEETADVSDKVLDPSKNITTMVRHQIEADVILHAIVPEHSGHEVSHMSVDGERKISCFEFELPKSTKKSTFELQLDNSGVRSESSRRFAQVQPDIVEVANFGSRVTESDLPEVDTYLTEMNSSAYKQSSNDDDELDSENDTASQKQQEFNDFGNVFGFRGFKKHIARRDTSRSDVTEMEENIPNAGTCAAKASVPISSPNSVSVLRMNFESSFEAPPSDDDDDDDYDETMCSSLNRNYLPESESYLPSKQVRIKTAYPGNVIEIGGNVLSAINRTAAENSLFSSSTAPAVEEKVNTGMNKAIPVASSAGHVRQRFDDLRTSFEESSRPQERTSAEDKGKYPGTQNENNATYVDQSVATNLLYSSDSDSDAMVLAAEMAVAQRKRKSGNKVGSSIIINAEDGIKNEVDDNRKIDSFRVSTHAPNSVTVSNSLFQELSSIPALQPQEVSVGCMPSKLVDEQHDVVTNPSPSRDGVYIVSTTKHGNEELPRDLRDSDSSNLKNSEVTVISTENQKYPSDSDEMKKKAASLDDLSYIPNYLDDSLRERATSLEFKLEHGVERKSSFRARRTNLPRSSTSMREVERYSTVTVKDASNGRDFRPPAGHNSENPRKGHSHSVFVQSYRRDQRASSLEGIPSCLRRSNSTKLAIHQSNVTVRSNPTLSLSTNNISPTNLEVNYDVTRVEVDEPKGGIISNIEISGDRGASITSLTHSSPWRSTSEELQQSPTYQRSSPHSSMQSTPETRGTTTIQVLESSMEPQDVCVDGSNNGRMIMDHFKKQYLNLRTNGLDSDAEDEVTVTTGDASFFTGPGGTLTNRKLASEWTHINGNIETLNAEGKSAKDIPRFIPSNYTEDFQLSREEYPEKAILTSTTQIRVLGEQNSGRDDN
ncbi:uncharacterized protein LOC108678433 [Hyalella azteca]|uniref:Uncharacterized protein LOC108678433 n=1 Tax=Hyalella azteca TaxID=294128 RepID=A0A979FMK7_HYAAZ|nr:uncharacterized protein LOC108678433 [Hyalella azteca]